MQQPDPDATVGRRLAGAGRRCHGRSCGATVAIGSTSVTDVEKELDAALAKANENYDLFLRAKADAENIRRRGQEEVAKAHKFAIESFAEALVPVVDSLEKALEVKDATAPSNCAKASN